MKAIQLGQSGLSTSRLAYGCWRIAGEGGPGDLAAGRQAVITAYERGYCLFDHADIYGEGRCETLFGQVLREVSGMRDRVLVATKCGIRFAGDPAPEAPFRYDFSADHILCSCDRSLQRLGIETIDLYQLHRPDYLMHPEEVAGAFSRLKETGKVREFGVSNFRSSQLIALQQACPMRLIVNQVEISLARLDCFEDGTLDHCLAGKVTPLAWSPLGGGTLGHGGRDLLPWQQRYETGSCLKVLDTVAQRHGQDRSVVGLAWLLKHPAGIVPIVGSTQPERIRQAVAATKLDLTREEWYHLLEAARGERLP